MSADFYLNYLFAWDVWAMGNRLTAHGIKVWMNGVDEIFQKKLENPLKEADVLYLNMKLQREKREREKWAWRNPSNERKRERSIFLSKIVPANVT